MRRFVPFIAGFFILLIVFPSTNVVFARADALSAFLNDLESRGLSVALDQVKENDQGGTVGEIAIKKAGDAPWELILRNVTFDALEETEGLGLQGAAFSAATVNFRSAGVTSSLGNFNAVDFSFRDLDAFLDVIGKNADKLFETKSFASVFANLGAFYKFVPGIEFTSLSVDTWVFDLSQNDLELTYSSGPTTLRAMREGVLEAYEIASVEFDSALGGASAFKATIDKAVFTDYNFKSIVRVLDDESYKNGTGDGIWLPTSGPGSVVGLSFSGPNGETRIRKIAMAAARIRQLDSPPGELFSILEDLAAPAQQPPRVDADIARQMIAKIASLYSAFEYDGFVIEGIDVRPPGKQSISIGDMTMDRFSYQNGISVFAIQDVNIVPANGEGNLKLDRFTIKDIRFPDLANVTAFLERQIAGDDTKRGYDAIAAYASTFGEMSLEGLLVERGAAGSFRVDGLSIALQDYIRLIPTKVMIELKNVDVLLESLPQPNRMAQVLKTMGYEKLTLDGMIEANWDEATGDLTLLPSTVSVRDMERINLAAVISGVPRAMIEDPENAALYAPALLLKETEVSFEDASVVNRVIDFVARQSGSDSDTVRAQYGIAALAPLTILQNPEFTKKAESAIQRFLAEPGSIALSLKPPQPVSLIGVGVMMQQSPGRIVDSLKLDISAQ